MEFSELVQKGKELLSQRPYGLLMDGVETEFDLTHDRRILDRYTFRLQCIDAVEARTECHVLGSRSCHAGHYVGRHLSHSRDPRKWLHRSGFRP